MRLALKAHPDFGCTAVSGFDVEIAHARSSLLELRYALSGDIAALAIPPAAAPERTDELWRRTCFEAFLRPEGGGEGYLELNFSPSTQWAAYRFSGYRDAMAPAGIQPPRIVASASARLLEVTVTLARADLPPGPCRLALSAVIEDGLGGKSYWALAHPPGRPDFHHEAGLASQLPAMEPS